MGEVAAVVRAVADRRFRAELIDGLSTAPPPLSLAGARDILRDELAPTSQTARHRARCSEKGVQWSRTVTPERALQDSDTRVRFLMPSAVS